jgi:hypothetical protein
MSFPYLRVVGGALLVLAGLVAFYGISIGASAALLLVLGGAAVVDSSVLTSLVLRADLGSINLVSHHLEAVGLRVPITLSASTGSVSMNVGLVSRDAVSLAASTSLGSVSQSLIGFSISQNTGTSLVATAGDIGSAPNSIVITATSGLGSVDLTARFV